jgi:hypothetical protein
MPVMITCQQGVNQGSTVSDRNPSPLMTISGGVWHTYDVTRPEHEIPRLGLKHPRGCVQQVDTSLVFNYLVIVPLIVDLQTLQGWNMVVSPGILVEPPLTRPIGGYTLSVSVPIRALSGEYVLIDGTPQSSRSSAFCECNMVNNMFALPHRAPPP